MFRSVPLSIIRGLFSVHSAMVYVIQICRQLSCRSRWNWKPVQSWSCSKAVYRLKTSSILVLLESCLQTENQFYPGPVRKLSTYWKPVPSWSCSKAVYRLKTSSILVLLESCLQTCMTHTIAECTVNKRLVMDRLTVRTDRVSSQNKFVKLLHLVGFIIKKCVLNLITYLPESVPLIFKQDIGGCT
jgi:hypothetical protein